MSPSFWSIASSRCAMKAAPYQLTAARMQEYNVAKRVEHSVKSLRHDGSTISAVNPRTYSRRFQDFISKVFV